MLDKKEKKKPPRKEKKISLYTMRHQYVVWRLMIGKVNIQNLAANIGSSVGKIESNYAHIKPVDYAEELVANQGKINANKPLNKQSALNKLLKILEEPPERTLFILISSNINLLIPTIQSRCQKIYFKEHSKSELKNYAEKHLKTDSIDEIIELSMGSIGQLVNTNSNTLNNVREVVDFFYDSNILSIEKLLSSFNKIKKNSDIELIKHLNILKITAKDLYLMTNDVESKSLSFNFLYSKRKHA